MTLQDFAPGDMVTVAMQDGRAIPAEVRRIFPEPSPSAGLIEVRFGTEVGFRRVELVPRRIVRRCACNLQTGIYNHGANGCEGGR